MNKCTVCGKPTHKKLSKFGTCVCSEQCIWILDCRSTCEGNYRQTQDDLRSLEDAIAELQGKVDVLLMLKRE